MSTLKRLIQLQIKLVKGTSFVVDAAEQFDAFATSFASSLFEITY